MKFRCFGLCLDSNIFQNSLEIVWIKEDTISEMGAGNRMKLIIPVEANLICETQFFGY